MPLIKFPPFSLDLHNFLTRLTYSAIIITIIIIIYLLLFLFLLLFSSSSLYVQVTIWIVGLTNICAVKMNDFCS